MARSCWRSSLEARFAAPCPLSRYWYRQLSQHAAVLHLRLQGIFVAYGECAQTRMLRPTVLSESAAFWLRAHSRPMLPLSYLVKLWSETRAEGGVMSLQAYWGRVADKPLLPLLQASVQMMWQTHSAPVLVRLPACLNRHAAV